jgi:two-component system sensor histidine kinase KdpD
MNTLSGTEEKLVGLIDRHASHLSDLANHLLLTAKLDSADLRIKREKIDLGKLIRNTVADSLQELDGHPVELQLSSVEESIYADRKLLQMALFQILDNAAKYSLPDSRVVIGLRDEEAESIISIRNEGSFIPDTERQKVFQRFYRCAESTRSISGTGIGLSVVRRIAEAHRGRTWVESDPVVGTTFAIALPRMAKERG